MVVAVRPLTERHQAELDRLALVERATPCRAVAA